jgi:hypothetical protein
MQSGFAASPLNILIFHTATKEICRAQNCDLGCLPGLGSDKRSTGGDGHTHCAIGRFTFGNIQNRLVPVVCITAAAV